MLWLKADDGPQAENGQLATHGARVARWLVLAALLVAGIALYFWLAPGTVPGVELVALELSS